MLRIYFVANIFTNEMQINGKNKRNDILPILISDILIDALQINSSGSMK